MVSPLNSGVFSSLKEEQLSLTLPISQTGPPDVYFYNVFIFSTSYVLYLWNHLTQRNLF